MRVVYVDTKTDSVLAYFGVDGNITATIIDENGRASWTSKAHPQTFIQIRSFFSTDILWDTEKEPLMAATQIGLDSIYSSDAIDALRYFMVAPSNTKGAVPLWSGTIGKVKSLEYSCTCETHLLMQQGCRCGGA